MNAPAPPTEADIAMRAAFAAMQKRCREDINAFSEWVFRDEKGGRTRQGAIQRAMHMHVEHCWKVGLHPAFLGPVEHTKTQQLITIRAAHKLGLDTSLRIKVICSNDDNAMKRVVGIQSLLRSPFYRAVFPNVRFLEPREAKRQGKKAKETMHELFVDREGHAIDPSVEATGILMAGTGGRADLLLFDDIVELRNAILQPELRPKVLQALDDTWMSRLTPSGLVCYTGQPWHEEDAQAELEKRPAWCTLIARISDDKKKIDLEVVNPPADYPIPEKVSHHPDLEALGPDVRLREKRKKLVSIRLFTERHDPWNTERLEKKEKENENAYRRRFELKRVIDGEMTFQHFAKAELPTVLGEAQRAPWPCVIGVDLSSKSRPGKCAVAVKVEPRTRMRYVVDVRYLKSDSAVFLDHIQDMASAYRAVQINVEDNGTQDVLIDMIGSNKGRWPFWMKVEPTTTNSDKKFNSISGLPGLDIEFKNGAWVFPKLEYDGIPETASEDEDPTQATADIKRQWWARLAREFRGHPVATTSDGVMATMFARQAIETLGLLLFQAR